MSAFFHTDAGGLWSEQAVGSELDYTLDWSDALDAGDAIALSEWTATPGVVVDRKTSTDTLATAWVSGGIGGRWYQVNNKVTTGTGRVQIRSFRVLVKGALPVAGSLFTDPVAAVASLRRDRLLTVAAIWLPGVELSDEYLLGKLLAAEKHAERRLRVFLSPREVVPEGTAPAAVAALVAAGNTVVVEPGYDQDPRVQQGDAWGLVMLRHRPVVRINAMRLVYPGAGSGFDIPADWIRIDRKYGALQLVPLQFSSQGGMTGLALSALAAGRLMPLAVHVSYRAGLEDAETAHPDIVNLIKRLAILDVLDDQFLPASGSTSVDGLSQSFAWDGTKHRAGVEDALDAARSSIHGLRLGVL